MRKIVFLLWDLFWKSLTGSTSADEIIRCPRTFIWISEARQKKWTIKLAYHVQRVAVPSCVVGGSYFNEGFNAGRIQSMPAFSANGFIMNNLETYCHYYTARSPRLRVGKVTSFLNCPSMRIEGCRRPLTERHASVVEPHPRPSLTPISTTKSPLAAAAVTSKGAFLKRAAQCVLEGKIK